MILPLTYRVRLVGKNQLTHDTYDFVFELLEPTELDFQAGQFVLVKIHHPETGELISRAYSIASPPSSKHRLTLNLNIVPNGKLTPLMGKWEVDYETEFQGPFGHFFFKSPPEREHLVFVATGTGVAPFRSMIEALLAQGDSRRITLYFGVRSQDHIFYRELFETLAVQHPNFTFVLTLSQPKEGWKGSIGRVTSLLPAIDFTPDTTDVYLCGGKPMIDDVRALFMEKGFDKTHIFFEQFFL